MNAKPWTKAEETLLRTLAPLGRREIERHLPSRTAIAINAKALQLRVSIKRLRRTGGRVNQWIGRIPIPPRAHPLVRRLFREMNFQEATIDDVAERAGLDPQTISHWRYTRSPSLTGLIAALNVLDLDLAVTTGRSKALDRAAERNKEERATGPPG